MYVLYLDEAGTHSQAANVVVGGVAVFERSTYWLKRELDDVAKLFFPTIPHTPLHANQFWVPDGGKTDAPYDVLNGQQRRQLADKAYQALSASKHGVLFATVIEKRFANHRDPYEVAFEDLISRFDLFLARKHAQEETQRGMVIIATSQSQERIQTIGHRILHSGTQWGRTKNLAEIPLFTLASNSRLLQAADLICNAVYARYERKLTAMFDLLLPRFDKEGDRLHGLRHLTTAAQECFCPACMSWRYNRTRSDGV